MKLLSPRSVLLALGAAALPAAGSTPGAQLTAPPVDVPWIAYPTSFYPQGLLPEDSALADLDGDGFLDLAVVGNSANPTLSILFGDGLGGFGAPTLTPTAVGSSSVEAVDLDGDGDLDLVVADTGIGSSANSVSVHENQGGGTFAPAVAWPVGGPPRGLAVADIDGDGNLDVAVTLQQSVGLLLGFGDGTFQPPVIFIVSSSARDVAAGDLNGDGDVDLVVAHDSQLSVLENIGIGFASPVVHASLPTGFSNGDANVLLADVDADGDLDALLSSGGTGKGPGGPGTGAIALFRNDGAGLFGTPEALLLDPALGGGPGASDVVVADVTGDGVSDVVATLSDSHWSILAGDGAGGFAAASMADTGVSPQAVEVGDLDGDGALDLLTLSSSSMEVCVHRNVGGTFVVPTFSELVDASVAPADSSLLNTIDVDLDGDLDVVIGYSENFNGNYGLSVRRNLGDGSLAPAELYTTPQFPEWLTSGDVDADGYPDLVWLDGWGAFNAKVRLKLNQGDGTFGPTTVLPGNYCEQDAFIRLIDMNADTLPEVVVYTCYDLLFVLRNTGNGSFAAPLSQRVSAGSGAFAGGDLNGDGFIDLVTNSGIQGYPEVHFGTGAGTLGAPVTVTTGRGVEALEIADLNGDGFLDVIAAYQLDGDGVSVLIGHGDGTFEPTADYPGTYTGTTDNLTVGDLDGDGFLDVLVASARAAGFWRGVGDGSLEPQRRLGAGLPTSSLSVGDFDGDGAVDLMALVEPAGNRGWFYPAVTLLPGRGEAWSDLASGLAGASGVPSLTGAGPALAGTRFQLVLADAAPTAPTFLVAGFSRLDFPLLGGVLVPFPDFVVAGSTSAAGGETQVYNWPLGATGTPLYFQSWVLDAGAPRGVAASNGLLGVQR